MRDPLADLYQRLTKPGMNSLKLLEEAGCAWANEQALLISRVGVLGALGHFNTMLALSMKFGSGAVPASAAEAKLIHDCCLHVCTGCHTKVIEKLTARARFSKHGEEIAAVSALLAHVSAIKAEDLPKLQALFMHLREEEILATPTAMKGRFVPQKAPEKWKSGRQKWPMVG